MAEKYSYQSTFDRLRHSKTVRAGVFLLGLAVAGCGASGSPSSSGVKAGKATPVAVGKRTPGTTAPTTAATTPAAPETGQASRTNWCRATAAIIEQAFVDPNAPNECEVMPASATPGDVLIKFTLNTAGAENYPVELSVINSPFAQFTGAAKPSSGGGTEYVVIPNSTMMYVEVPGNPKVTGELEVLTGEGGTTPLGVQNMIPQAAGAFAVFGSDSIGQLYPAGAQ